MLRILPQTQARGDGGRRKVPGAGGRKIRTNAWAPSRPLPRSRTRRWWTASLPSSSTGPLTPSCWLKGWSTSMPHGAEGRSDKEGGYDLMCSGLVALCVGLRRVCIHHEVDDGW